MYYTTGFTHDEIVDLCAMVRGSELEPGINHWPPVLGLFRSVVVTLTYLRRNRVQAELAETYGVSADDKPCYYRADSAAGRGAQGLCSDG